MTFKTMIALLAFISSCGNKSTTASTTPTMTSEEIDTLLANPEIIQNTAELGPCDKPRKGKAFFIETTRTFAYCSPPNWKSINLKNIDGANDLMAASFMSTKIEPPGKNCLNGGSALSIGKDLNNNKILDLSEITGTTYICSADPLLVNVKDFGAKGNNVADDSVAIMNAYAQAKKIKKPLYFPAGNYNIGTTQLEFAIDEFTSWIPFVGDGHSLSRINARKVTKLGDNRPLINPAEPDKTNPQVIFTCKAKNPCHNIHLTIKDLGFDVENPGDGVAIGSMDLNISDNVNEARLDFEVYNHSPSEKATAVTLNALYNADIRLIANVRGDGTALKVRKVSFSKFFGSYGAGVYKTSPTEPYKYLKGVAVRLADSFNDGNVFLALDMENVDVCVVNSSAANQGNTFIGGTFSWRSFGVQSTAGTRLMIQNPGINPTSGPATNLVDPSKNVQVLVTPQI